MNFDKINPFLKNQKRISDLEAIVSDLVIKVRYLEGKRKSPIKKIVKKKK